jgi:DNA-binding transcriptional LysR family regulator
MLTAVNLSALDLNLLLVLDAVLAERSVARAAKRLHVTPPAVSNALGRLRAALGDPIVTRSGRGIVPTPRALELGPKIRRALGEIGRALHGEPFDASTADPQITLGIADAGQLGKLPSIARALADEMPRARLRVVHVDTMVMLGGVGGTEVDVAIGVSHPGPSLHRRKLFDERFVVVARRDHPRIGARARKRDLAEASHVQVHVSLGQENKAIGAAYARLGIARRTTAIVPTFTAALAVAGATDAIATIPESVVAVIGDSTGVRVVSSPLAVAPLAMHMTWHERTDRDPALTCFRDVVMRALGGPTASR